MSARPARGSTCTRLRAVAVEAPDHFAGRGADFEDGVRRDRLAVVREGGEAAGVIEHGDFAGADRQRRRVGQRRAQAHLPGRWRRSWRGRPSALPLPSAIESRTGMVLIERASAVVSVIEPE